MQHPKQTTLSTKSPVSERRSVLGLTHLTSATVCATCYRCALKRVDRDEIPVIVVAVGERCAYCPAMAMDQFGAEEWDNGWVYVPVDGITAMAESLTAAVRPMLDVRVFADKSLSPKDMARMLRAAASELETKDAADIYGGWVNDTGGWNLVQLRRPEPGEIEGHGVDALRESLANSDLMHLADALATRCGLLEDELRGQKDKD